MLFVKSVTGLLNKALKMCDQAIEAADKQAKALAAERADLTAKLAKQAEAEAANQRETNAAQKLRAKLEAFAFDVADGAN
jgi:hypothetical protein